MKLKNVMQSYLKYVIINKYDIVLFIIRIMSS